MGSLSKMPQLINCVTRLGNGGAGKTEAVSKCSLHFKNVHFSRI